MMICLRLSDVNVEPKVRSFTGFHHVGCLRTACCSDAATRMPHGWKARWLPDVVAQRDADLGGFIAREDALSNAAGTTPAAS